MKRFMVTTALVTSAVLLVAQPAAASWREQFSATPSGASTWSFNAVSCAVPFSCMAVGNFNDNSGGHLLAESLSGSTWSVVTIPDPGAGQLTGIDCTSATSCEAVGQFVNGATTETLAEGWNGGTWSVQTTPNPSGATSSQLSDVSCTSATQCEAVGQFFNGATTETLAEGWNGSTWTLQTTPNPSGATSTVLNGVACPSASKCEAVGDSESSSTTVTLAEVWNGSTWANQTIADPSGTFNELNGLSCPTKTACMAVGEGFAERWNGTNWAVQKIGHTRDNLNRVSCTSATACMAVGGFFSEGILNQVAEQWNGKSWARRGTPITTSFDEAGLSDVSCTVSTNCAAVGFYHDPVDGDRALVERWSLQWQLQQPAIPSGAEASDMSGVSCPSQNFCMGIGGDELSGGGVFDSFSETWDNTSQTWTIVNTPNAANTSLNGVSCSRTTACTAVGGVDNGGQVQTLAERWNGASWTVQTTPNPSGGSRIFLLSVSCPFLNVCTAVGFYTNSHGKQALLAEQWNGTTWKIEKTPTPRGSNLDQLNVVSCTSSTACTAMGSAQNLTWSEVWNGKTWAIKNTPTPSGGRDAFLGGVSCVQKTACIAVGSYFNGKKTVPLAERWNGKSWAVQAAAVPHGSISELASVSCPTAKPISGCIATGFVTKGGVGLPLAEHWDGKTWKTEATQPPPASGTQTTLSSVSCFSVSLTCMAVGFYNGDTSLGEQYS
jgi:hypothetical protein